MRPSLKTLAILGVALSGLVSKLPDAQAAQVVLADPLTSWPLNFGSQSSVFMMKNGALNFVQPKNFSNYVSYAGFVFKDFDASVTVKATSQNAGDAGLLFWSNGRGDYYYFGVSSAQGDFTLTHYTTQNGGTWTDIVHWLVDPSVKTGPAAVNTLRIVAKGNLLQLYINGSSVGHATVMAPANGGALGLLGEGGSSGPTDASFSDFSVSQ